MAPPTANEGADSGTGTDSGAAPADAKAGLALHNEYRALHGAPALAWDEGLAKMAQDWANGCKFAHGGTDRGTGQNLYASSGSMSSYGGDYLSAPTKAWYGEEPQYAKGGYKEPAHFGSTGHFTQVVWKGTTKLGCAKNTVQCSQTIVVCNYKQAGKSRSSEKGSFPMLTLHRKHDGGICAKRFPAHQFGHARRGPRLGRPRLGQPRLGRPGVSVHVELLTLVGPGRAGTLIAPASDLTGFRSKRRGRGPSGLVSTWTAKPIFTCVPTWCVDFPIYVGFSKVPDHHHV